MPAGWNASGLPKAKADFALGPEKFQRLLAQTELVDLPPEKILEIGLAELKKEQAAFAEAAKVIDPNKSAVEVFKQIQSEHPTAESLLPDIGKDLEANPQIRDHAQAGDDSFGRSSQGERDTAVSPRHFVRFDGYAGAVRKTRERSVLLCDPA